MRSWEELNPWELLGVTPDASVDEIRSAYSALEQAFAPGSLALYSVADREEQTKLQRQLQVAYQRLLRAAGATEPPRPPEPVPPPPFQPAVTEPVPGPQPATAARATTPPAIVATVNTSGDVTGEDLRAVREAWGLTLDVIAKRTRVPRDRLADIENDSFGTLPARVFTRGFVMAYARELRLDPDLVWRCFERRWQAHAPIPHPGLPRL